VNAVDIDGDPQVEFIIDGATSNPIDDWVRTPPFIYHWQNPAVGGHNITARVFDDVGASASISFSINVVAAIQLRTQLLAEGTFVLDFDAPTGRRYRVFTSIDLAAWTDAGVITADNGRALFQTSLEGEAKFFRIAEEP
jgi:hypothetical protein